MFRDFLDCGSLVGFLGSDSMPTGNRRLCFASLWHWNETVSKDCYNANLEGYAYKEIFFHCTFFYSLKNTLYWSCRVVLQQQNDFSKSNSFLFDVTK